MSILQRWWGRAERPVPLCERCCLVQQKLKHDFYTTQPVLSFAFDELRRGCSVCLNLHRILVADSFPAHVGPQDRFELWRYSLEIRDTNGLIRQIRYFRLRLLTTFRELWMVPSDLSPAPSLSTWAKRYGNGMWAARASLQKCISHHGQICNNSKTKDLKDLTVLDCVTRELRILPKNSSYACLSYVWGTSNSQDTARVDLRNLPRTMEDAIEVTVLLGLQYLWIDRYCIDQANAAEKHLLISQMDVIYQGATFTIIAAAGDGPHAGLPGIRESPCSRLDDFIVNGKPHTVFAHPRLEISGTTWSSRGWTYQEMLLSSRRLAFTRSQLYFQCNAMHCSDLINANFAKATGPTGPLRAFPHLRTEYVDDYILDCLREYYRRRLSYPTDAIKAFLGVIGAFHVSRGGRNFRASQFYGIPILYFDSDRNESIVISTWYTPTPQTTFLTGLAWSISDNEQWPPHANENTEFPSWSWASVKANRKNDDCGVLDFPTCLPPTSSVFGRTPQIYLEHRSQGRMKICGHKDQWSDHDMYHPWIDVESWTTICTLIPEMEPGGTSPRSASPSHSLSGFAGGVVSLDYGSRSHTAGPVAIVLLGKFYQFSPRVAIFLVLEELTTGRYRRIGLYRSVEHERCSVEHFWKLLTPTFAVEQDSADITDGQNRSKITSKSTAPAERTWQLRTLRVF